MTANCPTCKQALPAVDGVTVDEASRALILDGQSIKLSKREFSCFMAMWLHRPFAMSQARIHQLMYGADIDGGPELRLIDVMICKLRQKFDGTRLHIETHREVGYRVMVGAVAFVRPRHWKSKPELMAAE